VLEALVTSRVKRKLLVLFFTNPENEFYVREIARRLKEETNAVRRELQALENGGILLSYTKGNLKYFKANKKCPIFGELKTIVLKTEGLGEVIKERLKDQKIRFAFIYGSYAKEEERKGSDIDLMVIGDVDMAKFNQIISNLERSLGREINYLIYPEAEFLKKCLSGFMQDVINGKKIMLIGEIDEFERFAKYR
jgi:predicted nucleotidyltransferase